LIYVEQQRGKEESKSNKGKGRRDRRDRSLGEKKVGGMGRKKKEPQAIKKRGFKESFNKKRPRALLKRQSSRIQVA